MTLVAISNHRVAGIMQTFTMTMAVASAPVAVTAKPSNWMATQTLQVLRGHPLQQLLHFLLTG